MIQYYCSNILKCTKEEYQSIIQKIFCQQLKFCKNKEFQDLIDTCDICFGIDPNIKNQVFFKILFQKKPRYYFLKKIYYSHFKNSIDETRLIYEIDANKIFNLNNIIDLAQFFIEDLYINTNSYQKFNFNNFVLDNNKLQINFENEELFSYEFEEMFNELKNFLEFLYKKNDLKVNYNIINSKEKVQIQKSNIVKIIKEKKIINNKISDPIKKIDCKEYQIIFLKDKVIKRKKIDLVCLTNYTKTYLALIENKNKKLLNQLKPGMWIIPELNFENHIPNLFDCEIKKWTSITIPSQFERKDTYENKLANLNVHTKFSTLDSVAIFDDYLNLAQSMGQKIIAITDFNSVQSYPNIIKKNNDLKVIYGVELEVIDKNILLAANINSLNKKYSIDNANYVIFDIETTGLFPLYDDIIEIACAKYNKGVLISSYHQFIKTNKIITSQIQEITNITNEMIEKDGVNIIDALEKFKMFTKNCVLVAHNGINFDLAFINAHLRKHHLEEIENILLDTMQMSRRYFEKEKGHTLGSLARRLNVNYDEDLAHRADKDVEVLGEVFFKLLPIFINELKIDNKKDFTQFNNLQYEKLYEKNIGHNILIYAKNDQGIKTLYELVSLAHTKYYFKRPVIFWDDIERLKENIVIANSPINTKLMQDVLNDDYKSFIKHIEKYDFLLIAPPSCYDHDVNRGFYKESDLTKGLSLFYKWAIEQQKPIIPNASVNYLNPWQEKAYSVLVHSKGIGGITHKLYSYRQSNQILPKYHFRTTNELMQELTFLKTIDGNYELEFLNNFSKFLKHFEFNIKPLKNILCPPTMENVVELFKKEIFSSLYQKYGTKIADWLLQRVKKEMDAIIKHNFTVIYWVSHLLVKKSLEDGYLVGSRGSVGSSFIAFLLNITEVNPLAPHYLCHKCFYLEQKDNVDSGYDLKPISCPKCKNKMFGDGQNIPFETFMGFDADKIPDIDLNFSGEYQIQAHNFLRSLFGEEYCFRAGTISTLAEKTAYGFVKKYYEQTNNENTLGELEFLVQQIIDVKRTTGQHPGGILVVPNNMNIYDFTPINFPADDIDSSWKTTHLAFENLHDALLKFDILGHDDPTILKILKDLTKIDPLTIPNYDENVLKIFSNCRALKIEPEQILNETTGAIGLPEFGTQFVRQMLKTTNPQSFADLVRISGLSHGTDVWRNNAETLIKKNKLKLKEVISCRDDIMVYLIKQKVEPLKAFEIMEKVRKGKQIAASDIEILKKHDVPDWYIDSANAIKYMFPKAHATAYVLMAWRVAYYKYYYPLEYYATYFTIRSDNFDVKTLMKNDPKAIKDKYNDIQTRLKSSDYLIRSSVKTKEQNLLIIYEVALEMFARKIYFSPISLEKSDALKFLIEKKENKILIPFISIDGLGDIKAKSIVESRNLIGEFKSLDDFQNRTKISRSLIETFQELEITTKLNKKNQISIFDL